MAGMSRLLVVEDDETIAGLVADHFTAHGYDIVRAPTGRAALDQALGGNFDLVLLDLGLPDLDGIAVCRELRARLPGAVVVMLTARSAEVDVVLGLEAGADDYLTKPVRLSELIARVRAHLRRGSAATAVRQVEAIGDLVIDAAARRVTVAGRDLALRAKEFDLLARLVAEPDVAIPRETLMSDVWDEHWFGPTKTLDVHIAALRRRLATLDAEVAVPRIVTVRGHGYRLETPQANGEPSTAGSAGRRR